MRSSIVDYSNTVGPAGVAGSPINLGLSDLVNNSDTLTISGVPTGWILSAGADNGDGSWTVQTSDLASLTVTTPDTYVGAVALKVATVQGDGNLNILTDNVEAYAPGNPIFAISGDDHLTGSSGDDTFVFSQPIGHDIVNSFDVAHDKVDLIGYAGFTSFADVQTHLANDTSGNAMLTLGDGQSITFVGVDAGALTADDFLFEITPVTDNPDAMVVSDGALLPLSGVVNNTGLIILRGEGNGADLELIQHGITLQGGGQVIMTDDTSNAIFGTASDVLLTNVDNTISGAGQIGQGQMTLVNEGTIIANYDDPIDIDTGANVVVNTGTLESNAAGGLIIHGDLSDEGLLWANNGNVMVGGNVSGNGTAEISGNGTMEFGAASNEHIAFDSDASGTLKLDHSADFSGVVAGFDGNDVLDLGDIAAANASFNFTANEAGTGGTLQVTDGTHTANINLQGQYATENFHVAADAAGGTLVSYVLTGVTPPEQNH